MALLQHVLVAQFKEGVVVEDIMKKLEKLVSEMDSVKSFVWGHDTENPEIMRKGFTHAMLMTFSSKEEYNAFVGHPKHEEFIAIFGAAIEKALLLHFPAVIAKAPA